MKEDIGSCLLVEVINSGPKDNRQDQVKIVWQIKINKMW